MKHSEPTTGKPHTYCLVVWDDDAGNIESVEVSRREYVTLKRELARLRGYTILPHVEENAESTTPA